MGFNVYIARGPKKSEKRNSTKSYSVYLKKFGNKWNKTSIFSKPYVYLFETISETRGIFHNTMYWPIYFVAEESQLWDSVLSFRNRRSKKRAQINPRAESFFGAEKIRVVKGIGEIFLRTL